MPSRNGKWKRRNYLINKDLQGKYIFYFFIIVTISSIMFTLIFSLLAQDTLTIVYKDNNLQLGKTPQMLVTEILKAHWIFILLSGVIVSLVAIFLTHRFAGPIYRFEQSADKMINGNLDFTISLRKEDAGKELAKMINAFNTMLSARLLKLRELSDRIDLNLPILSRSTHDNETGKAALGSIQASSAEIRDILDTFNIKGKQRVQPPLPAGGPASPGSDREFTNIVMRVRELAANLEELLDLPSMTHLVDDIDVYLAKFSHELPAAGKTILSETADIIRQTRDVEARLREVVNSCKKIMQ